VKLSKVPDETTCRFLSVSQRFNFMACNCPMFTPVNSNTNFFLKKILRCWGQDKKIIKLVKITSQSRSWANIAWGSWWSNTYIFFRSMFFEKLHIFYRGMLLLAAPLTIQSLYNGARSYKLLNLKDCKIELILLLHSRLKLQNPLNHYLVH